MVVPLCEKISQGVLLHVALSYVQTLFLRALWKVNWAKHVAMEEVLGLLEQFVVPLPGRLLPLFGAWPLLLVGLPTPASVFPSPFVVR